jgi:hypothetical protein
MSQSPPLITYIRLCEMINNFRQGIMPTTEIQEWYRRLPRENRNKLIYVNENSEYTNTSDVDEEWIYWINDVNQLTSGRLYELICFKGENFEQRYLYEGTSTRMVDIMYYLNPNRDVN